MRFLSAEIRVSRGARIVENSVMSGGLAKKTLQDWDVRARLRSVKGVSEVNSWGGETRQYQIEIDPNRLQGYGLTLREREIVREIASGSSNRDIAKRFGIAEPTVKRHLANIFDKIGVSTRLELAVVAIERGLAK